MIYLSTHDTLTGIRNRRYAQERLDQECLRSARDGNPYSVAMMDVDQFKRFNDTYGHECGDVVLRGIAEAMAESVRETDAVSRWGGEEFLIILPGTGLQGAVEVAEKIRLKIQDTEFEYGGERLRVTVTAGVMSTGGNESAETCVRLADMALLSGKAKGRNIVVASLPDEGRSASAAALVAETSRSA
jgi:diguanylate cyclase (GGDEF)-like protein